jgi:insertion element IS1 protein InsB
LEDTLLPSEAGDVLELDELWSFVGAKWNTCWGGWRFVGAPARSSPTRWGIAPSESAFWLREAIPEGYARRATRSDFWEPHEIAFPARTHRCCGKEEGETNHVERWFGTLRACMSRVVRLAYSFSKSEERHAEAIHLFITNYNLQIQAKQR